ncbi:hypothetical protein ANCCAN_27246 [Ancylostoma caninum]|uniref:Uncharacterized protein n=1 Tax=Ancylostoma caninum TaxID=29170 RepID=A0A368F4P8_ANCCA|nr:hypothetical protein ANCCAN_27246 [Ancylostoma caninum]
MLPDFRPKFDFNNVIESCQKSTNGDESRIDGGSDSPTPNDDEVHSNSDGAEMSTFPHIKQVVRCWWGWRCDLVTFGFQDGCQRNETAEIALSHTETMRHKP